MRNILNKKVVFSVAVIAVLLIIITLVINNKFNINQVNLRSKSQPNWLFKELHANKDSFSKIAAVAIETSAEKLTIIKEQDNWLILEKYRYPALLLKVKELLFGLLDLKIIDPKSNNPENFASMDLDLVEPGKNTVKITLLDKEHQELDSIYLGKREFIATPNANYQHHIFVRRPAEQKTWLVAGNMPEGFGFKDLVKQPLINIDIGKVSSIKLIKANDPKNYIYIKRNLANNQLTLSEIPKGFKVKDEYIIDNILQQFSYLNYDDVVKDPGNAKTLLSGEITVFTIGDQADISEDNNLNKNNNAKIKQEHIKFELIYIHEGYYFKLLADKATLAGANNWLYKISEYTSQSLLINKSDLLDNI